MSNEQANRADVAPIESITASRQDINDGVRDLPTIKKVERPLRQQLSGHRFKGDDGIHLDRATRPHVAE